MKTSASTPDSDPKVTSVPNPTLQVLARCESEGWTSRPGVELMRGTWQEMLPTLSDGSVDAIFYDTHDEGVEGS